MFCVLLKRFIVLANHLAAPESANGKGQFRGGCAGLGGGNLSGGRPGGVHARRAGGDWLGIAQTFERDVHQLRRTCRKVVARMRGGEYATMEEAWLQALSTFPSGSIQRPIQDSKAPVDRGGKVNCVLSH